MFKMKLYEQKKQKEYNKYFKEDMITNLAVLGFTLFLLFNIFTK